MKDAEVIEAMAWAIDRSNLTEAGWTKSEIDDALAHVSEPSKVGMKLARAAFAALPTPHDGLTDTNHHAGSSADEGECQRDKMKGKCSGWESPDERCPLGKHNGPCRCWCSPEDPCPACRPSDWGAVNDELMRRAASPAPPHQGGKSE